jgi:hypothetical protein
VKSFVVRVWTPDQPAGEEGKVLHGLVEHVGSGRSTPFADEQELLAFLREAALADPAAPATSTVTRGGRP